MPDGPIHFNLNVTETSCEKITVTKMRKDSQSSLGSESIDSPEILNSVERSPSKRGQMSKKVSFPDHSSRATKLAKPKVINNSDSDGSAQSINGDEEVFEMTETKRLLKPISNVQRTQSHREVNASQLTEQSAKSAGQCKRPKRSASFRDGIKQGVRYQILMLGAVGVGKTSLVNQFQHANHCGSVSIKISNVYGENCKKSEDAQLVIFDHPATEITAEMAITCCEVDAYVVVYSVTDRESFKTARQILKVITSASSDSGEKHCNKAAILVGNKVDLVRRRVVSTEEGKNAAMSNGSKFIETSDWIDYNVAELFNGVLAQIQLRTEMDGGRGRLGYRRSKTLGTKSWSVLKDFLNLINRKVVSCDDLQTL
ncbi:GTP binding protein overexpressed in skeletal muscle [Chamberlinius hualienensis]